MKKLYFFQVNYLYGSTAHLPYTAAQLSCYAFSDKTVKEHYVLEDIFFIREDIDALLGKISEPAVAAFSSYIWNFEYNKAVAKRIKELYPECKIIFGGHHVKPGDALLQECPYIDYAIHGEGEKSFKRLLLSLTGLYPACDIPGVSYRAEDGVHTNPAAAIESTEYLDYPSPYLEGYFDKILASNPDITFMALIETARGCPNSCAYCDWSDMKSHIRKFPLEKVLAEIRWISEHNIFGLGSADSNFGIYERDEQIADYIVEMFLQNGTPQGFQTSYAKNSNERIFRIGRKLDKYRLNKGVTLSFQSMDERTLECIGRKNIALSSYKELMKMYNEAGVATYTELILGLPGESYESFADGIDQLLNMGQHGSLYIHNCEHLPCSVMANPDYMEKYKIKCSVIPLNQPHIDNAAAGGVQEYSSLVTSTFSMSSADWVRMNIFSFTVQGFHHMGLLQFIALYLHREKNVSYRAFYESLVQFASENQNSFLGALYGDIKGRLENIVNGAPNAAFVCTDNRFGGVHWSFEEYMFLCAVYDSDRFFDEIRAFLKAYFEDGEFLSQLLYFQKEMIKRPFESSKELHFSYDFLSYFKALLKSEKAELERRPNTVFISSRSLDSWAIYAKTVVWFGRKDSRGVYLNEAKLQYDL